MQWGSFAFDKHFAGYDAISDSSLVASCMFAYVASFDPSFNICR